MKRLKITLLIDYSKVRGDVTPAQTAEFIKTILEQETGYKVDAMTATYTTANTISGTSMMGV